MAGQVAQSSASKHVAHWDAAALLGAGGANTPRYAAILLNQPITKAHRNLVARVWQQASLRLCADGGANRLYDCYGDKCTMPHEIRGDLDSLRPDVRAFFEEKHNVKIVKAASQYATDLQKCVLRVEEEEEEKESSVIEEHIAVVIIGGLSGRLDQTVHTMHVLCQLAQEEAAGTTEAEKLRREHTSQGLNEDDFVTLQRRAKTVVLNENSVAWVLGKGKHCIEINHDLFGPTCGLVPFAAQIGDTAPAVAPRIWTQGLEWDLTGEKCSIGGFLSTSNHLKANQVTVDVEAPIIWTMEIKEDDG